MNSSANIRTPEATELGMDGPRTQIVVWAGGQLTPGAMLSQMSISNPRSASRPPRSRYGA